MNSLCHSSFFISTNSKYNTKKASTYPSRPYYLFISTIIKRWFQLFSLHPRSLTNRFVCNFLSSSAGFNLCSCFFPAHPCLPLSLPTFLGRPFHGSSPLPFRFLTPAVSAFFRPPQFWILTTQPLFFLSSSSRFRLTAAFPVPASALASSVSTFSPTWFPMSSFRLPVLGSTVGFLSFCPASLPQPFHR